MVLAPTTLATLSAGAATGAGSAIGGMVSAQKSRAATRDAQQMQMDWEFLRARNAHQWEVEDLKKAGLNPILSAGGSGAVTGGISAPVPDTSGYAEAGKGIGAGIATAIDAMRLKNENAKNDAEVITLLKDAVLKEKQGSLIDQQTINEATKNGNIKADTAHKLSLVSYTNAATAQQKMQNEITAKTLDAQINKVKLEIAVLYRQNQILKSEGKIKEAHKVQEELNAKHATLNYWTDMANKMVGIGLGVGATALTAGKATPLLKAAPKVGFL